MSLAGVTASVPVARAFVRRTLSEWGLEALVDTAALVVSELATNAVLHARSPFVVRLRLDAGGGFSLEVIDGSARRPARRAAADSATTGRGLSIVAQLASAWGVEQREEGKAVWARLAAASGRPGSLSAGSPAHAPPRRRRPKPGGPVARAA